MTRSMRPTSPNPRDVGFPVSRRTMLAGMAGTAGVAGIAACGGGSSSGSSSGAAAAPGKAKGTITFGSNASDAVPKAAYASVFSDFSAANPKAKLKINTVEHNTFQTQINTYLQGTPDDVFTWFAGYRMQLLRRARASPPTIRRRLGDDRRHRLQRRRPSQAVEGSDDGQATTSSRSINYPWVVFYRQERVRGQARLHHPHDHVGRLPQGPGQVKMKTDGIIADRLRGQGRLARPRHLRHHQPARPTATTSTSS